MLLRPLRAIDLAIAKSPCDRLLEIRQMWIRSRCNGSGVNGERGSDDYP